MIEAVASRFGNVDWLERAIERCEEQLIDSQPRYRDELAAVERQVRKVEASIDGYFTAFEAGTMSDAQCAARIRSLNEQLAQLQTRRDELSLLIESETPVAIDKSILETIAGEISEILERGPVPQVKALIQKLVVRIRVEGMDILQVTFRLPEAVFARHDGVVDRPCHKSNRHATLTGPLISL